MKRNPMSRREHYYWLQAVDDISYLYEWRCELLWEWYKRHETKEAR